MHASRILLQQAKSDLVSRLPKRLRPYASRLKNAPLSHVTSFLILHELTAILPVGGLIFLFHQTNWIPEGLPSEYIEKGAISMGKMTKKYGFESFAADRGMRLVMEGAAAFAVVKVLFPVRIGLSLLLTPWFARHLVAPVSRLFGSKAKA